MSRWRRYRAAALVVLALVLAIGVALWTGGSGDLYSEPGDPGNPRPDGGQALARVLADQGVDVDVVRSADALEDAAVDARTTVVVTGTDALSPSTLARLRAHARPGRLVLVEPAYRLLEDLEADLSSLPSGEVDEVAADCAPGGGPAAGTLDGLALEVDDATAYTGEGCFATRAGVLLRPVGDGVLLFGAGQALTNDQVTRADNAAVALRLLGQDRRLVWYVPDLADANADETVTLSSLLPDWIGPALWLGALSALGLVLWRVRRLGPLTTEPLPVVVRAVETAVSRGRMYRRSRDRAHAAQALRRAARTDLADQLHLGRHADAATVADAAHGQLGHLGIERTTLDLLLDDHRPPPANDQELVRLAQELARLRREVRRG